MNKVLEDVRNFLGVETGDPMLNLSFDMELLVDINMAVMVLYDSGTFLKNGPNTVVDKDTTWTSIFEDKDISLASMYVMLETKRMFDPPTNSSYNEAIKSKSEELLWRLRRLEDESS